MAVNAGGQFLTLAAALLCVFILRDITRDWSDR